jgi:hypothetical protein
MKELLPLNMSFQSLNKDTLKIIKRGNMPMDTVREMVAFARANGIASSTELISGLPKESYDSFRGSFLTAIQLRLDSVYMGALYLIKGSELYTAESREENKFKTNFALIETDVTKIDGRWVFDMDEIVVEHSHMTQDEFYKLYRFKLWGQVAYAAAYLKEIIMHCLNYGISPLELYDELIANTEDFSFINTILTDFIESIKPLYFETPQELEEKLTEHIEEFGNVDLFYYNRHFQLSMAKVLGRDNKVTFVNEVVEAARRLYKGKMTDETIENEEDDFYSILEDLREIQPVCIISPLDKQERVMNVSCNYDLKAWADDNYDNRLLQYKTSQPQSFSLVVRNIQEHDSFRKETVDFRSIAEKYEYFYNVMVSSNLRRYITYSDSNDQQMLPGAVHPMENNEVTANTV